MKKVLILAHDYPPLRSVGALRPAAWAKYLPENGWQPLVIVRNWTGLEEDRAAFHRASASLPPSREGGATVWRVGNAPSRRDRLVLRHGTARHSWLRRLLSALQLWQSYRRPTTGLPGRFYHAALEAIEQEQPDLMLATGEPFWLFGVARAVSLRTGVPWVADYRDLWTRSQDPGAKPHSGFLANFFRRRELRWLPTAAGVVTAAPAYAAQLAQDLGRPVHVAMNGYDAVPARQEGAAGERFQLAYAGRLYPYQRVETMLEGLALLPDAVAQRVLVTWYGTGTYPEHRRRIEAHPAFRSGQHEFLARLPYAQVMVQLAAADALLLLTAPGALWLPAKLFDYVAAGRPILSVEGDQGQVESILAETGAGIACNSPQELATELQKLMQAERTESSPPPVQYSRKHQAAVLAAWLDQLLAKK